MSWHDSDLASYFDADELLKLEYALEDFVQDTSKKKGLEDVAREADELLMMARSFRVRAQSRIDKLGGVMRGLHKVVEGKGDAALKNALLAFRGE